MVDGGLQEEDSLSQWDSGLTVMELVPLLSTMGS